MNQRAALRGEDSVGSVPKVSVLMLAYNHERFVAQAIESVLMQVTDFDFELVIGNDCSADGTEAILKCFQATYPGKILVQQTERNMGMHENFARTLALCRGEYVAIIEGDDYWTAADKLQVQTDYLDKNRSCALCFHQVNLVRGRESNCDDVFPEGNAAILHIEDLLQSNSIPTCSIVFRRRLLSKLPDWCMDLKILDWPLVILLLQKGNAGLLNRSMGAYRIHSDGLWTQTPHKARSEIVIEVLRCMDKHFQGKYSRVIRRRIAEAYFHISWCDEEENHLTEALKANWKAIDIDPFGSREYKINYLRLFARKMLPGFCAWLQRSRFKNPSPLAGKLTTG